MDMPARAPDRNRAISAYYDGMTSYYRLFYSPIGLHYGLWDRHTFTLRQALINHKEAMFARLGEVDADSHILDAGCGCGWTSVFLCRRGRCRVTGITLSAEQVRLARRLAGGSRVGGRVDFLQRDFCDSGFPDSFFSHVIASESSCHAGDKAVWLAEMHRVLRPGGRLVIADYYLRCREADLDTRQRQLYGIFCRGFTVPNLPFLGDMEDWIAAAGFQLVGNVDITRALIPTARHIRLLGLLTLPFALLLQALRLAPPELVPHLRTCISQPAALRDLGSYRLLTLERR